jgi:Arc/MetJ-type ribon-helix-helix transcriptional regulator
MKKRVSATINEKTLRILNSLLKDGTFRNKSHAIEKAIELLNEGVKK